MAEANVETVGLGDEPEPEHGLLRTGLTALGRFWIFLFLLALVAYFSITTPDHAFFGADNFKTIALDTSVVILLALGQTFVIITGGIDLSVGGILLLSGVAGGLVMLELSGTEAQTANLQYPHAARAIPVGLVVILAVATFCGLVNGLIVTRLKMPPFIVTLGTLGITFGAADLLSGGTNLVSVPTSLQDTLGNGRSSASSCPSTSPRSSSSSPTSSSGARASGATRRRSGATRRARAAPASTSTGTWSRSTR
jgi:ribose transport system permease protein